MNRHPGKLLGAALYTISLPENFMPPRHKLYNYFPANP